MASQSADGHVYAPINPCSPICNMQLNVLNDLAEAMKALERKKIHVNILKRKNRKSKINRRFSKMTPTRFVHKIIDL
jgi:hypothetical protein